MNKTYYIETWGCQMNDLDSQRIAGQLKLRGYRAAASEDEASLILLNTCSIREKSEQKVFSRLGWLRAAKSRGARIGVAGCVAQQEGERILERAPYVDFVLGTGNVGTIDSVLDGSKRVAIDFPEAREYDYLSIERPSATRAQITVIEGCNKNCTYCIVPTTRGREISRPLHSIIAEVEHAVSTGRVEIELLGQTVNAYRCPESGADFASLLEEIAKMAGVLRIRYMTSHPVEVSDRMIDVTRAFPNICRFLHLPVQSGSSAVLRRMKRLYTRERYLETISRIRAAVPEMSFSTDFIVGFPGETDDDFEQTLSLMREVKFGSLFAFKYSPRPGTPAVKLSKDTIPAKVADERLQRLFALQEEIQREKLLEQVGRTLEVLYEQPSRHDDREYAGKTDDNMTVNFRAALEPRPGTLIPVKITRAMHYTLAGEAAS
jgi:tRNA-2-methylthio-N6-dimethylallyladenosine synthase